jgi:hypothetical protein
MKANILLCRAQCASCHLFCIRSRIHDGDHCCETSHNCAYDCEFCKDSTKSCGLAAGHPGKHVCVLSAHLCGDPCKLSGKPGCLEDCTKVIGHTEDEHICSALAHMCGEPCALRNIQLVGRKTFSCQENCSNPRHVSCSGLLSFRPMFRSAASSSTTPTHAIRGFAQ